MLLSKVFMTKALIGHTGFVGGNLLKQASFDATFNTSNITEIKGTSFDLLVIAAPSAEKWKVNQEPDKDLSSLGSFMELLKTVTARQVILISTVDVYPAPQNVDEGTFVDPEKNHAYGKHRFYLESFVRECFPNHLIVRLPGLFGNGLKKNFIYDMLKNGTSDFTHKDSIFQFYCLDTIWSDIETALNHNLSLINFATEPVSAHEVAEVCFGIPFEKVTSNTPAAYDMKTRHASTHGKEGHYLYSKEEIFDQLKRFITHYEL